MFGVVRYAAVDAWNRHTDSLKFHNSRKQLSNHLPFGDKGSKTQNAPASCPKSQSLEEAELGFVLDSDLQLCAAESGHILQNPVGQRGDWASSRRSWGPREGTKVEFLGSGEDTKKLSWVSCRG